MLKASEACLIWLLLELLRQWFVRSRGDDAILVRCLLLELESDGSGPASALPALAGASAQRDSLGPRLHPTEARWARQSPPLWPAPEDDPQPAVHLRAHQSSRGTSVAQPVLDSVLGHRREDLAILLASLGVGEGDRRAGGDAVPIYRARVAGGLDRAGVTSLVDRLESEGLVARTASTTDRRVVLIELQPAIWASFASIYRPLGQRVQATAASWAPAEFRTVTHALEALTTAFEEARALLGS